MFDRRLVEVDLPLVHGNRHVGIEQQVRVDDLAEDAAVRRGQRAELPGAGGGLRRDGSAGRRPRKNQRAVDLHARELGVGRFQ